MKLPRVCVERHGKEKSISVLAKRWVSTKKKKKSCYTYTHTKKKKIKTKGEEKKNFFILFQALKIISDKCFRLRLRFYFYIAAIYISIFAHGKVSVNYMWSDFSSVMTMLQRT